MVQYVIHMITTNDPSKLISIIQTISVPTKPNKVEVDENDTPLNSELEELLSESSKLPNLAPDNNQAKESSFKLEKEQHNKLVQLLAEAEKLQQKSKQKKSKSSSSADSRKRKEKPKKGKKKPIKAISESYKDLPDPTPPQPIYNAEETEELLKLITEPLPTGLNPVTAQLPIQSESYKWLPADRVEVTPEPHAPAHSQANPYYQKLSEEIKFIKDSLTKLEALHNVNFNEPVTEPSILDKDTNTKEIMKYLNDQLVKLENEISENKQKGDERDEKYESVVAGIQLLEDEIVNLENIIRTDIETGQSNSQETHKIMSGELEMVVAKLDSLEERERADSGHTAHDLEEVEEIVVKLEDFVLLGDPVTVDTGSKLILEEELKATKSNQTKMKQPEQPGEASKPKTNPILKKPTPDTVNKTKVGSRKIGTVKDEKISNGDSKILVQV